MAATATVAAARRARGWREEEDDDSVPFVGSSWSSSSDLRDPGKAVTTHQPRKSAVAPSGSQLCSAIQKIGRPT